MHWDGTCIAGSYYCAIKIIRILKNRKVVEIVIEARKRVASYISS